MVSLFCFLYNNKSPPNSEDWGLNVKFRLFSILARITTLYLEVHRKITPPARKSDLFMAITLPKIVKCNSLNLSDIQYMRAPF